MGKSNVPLQYINGHTSPFERREQIASWSLVERPHECRSMDAGADQQAD